MRQQGKSEGVWEGQEGSGRDGRGIGERKGERQGKTWTRRGQIDLSRSTLEREGMRRQRRTGEESGGRWQDSQEQTCRNSDRTFDTGPLKVATRSSCEMNQDGVTKRIQCSFPHLHLNNVLLFRCSFISGMHRLLSVVTLSQEAGRTFFPILSSPSETSALTTH